MKCRLLFILTLLTISCFGQEFEKIIFTSQQADEPPTKQGRPKYTIEFLGQSSGDFVATDFHKDKKRKKLNRKVSIDKERIEKITEWEKSDKMFFGQSELGFDISALKLQSNYELNFDIPIDLTVNVDSFQFCRTYNHIKSITIGGQTLTVTLVPKSDQKVEFVFDEGTKDDNFNLQDYFLCYKLLGNIIPDEVPSYGFFSKSNFMDIVLYYQKIVECEGFYYKEYTDKNPNMTAKDRRMKTGWNFIEYMGQRNKNE